MDANSIALLVSRLFDFLTDWSKHHPSTSTEQIIALLTAAEMAASNRSDDDKAIIDRHVDTMLEAIQRVADRMNAAKS